MKIHLVVIVLLTGLFLGCGYTSDELRETSFKQVALAFDLSSADLHANTDHCSSFPDSVIIEFGNCVQAMPGGRPEKIKYFDQPIEKWGYYGSVIKVDGKNVMVTFSLPTFKRPNTNNILILSNRDSIRGYYYKELTIKKSH